MSASTRNYRLRLNWIAIIPSGMQGFMFSTLLKNAIARESAAVHSTGEPTPRISCKLLIRAGFDRHLVTTSALKEVAEP